MIIKQSLVFPLAAAINFFSVTVLLIVAGLLGKGELAADIAITQGAIVAVFLSLSGNARNLILASSSPSDEKSLFYFRLIVMFPAVIAVFYLTMSAVEMPIYLIIGLVVRKCSEWFAELQLANREVRDDFIFASKYALINSIGLLMITLMLLVPSLNDYFSLTLYFWAFLPIVFSLPYVQFISGLRKNSLNFSQLIPHMGSSTVIGISTYIFRILIVILAGKILAGQMFAAYALGGVVSSLYTYAIGPTLMLKNTNNQKIFLVTVFTCIAIGGIVVLYALFWNVNLYPSIFVLGIGISLIGGGIMIVAQKQRLYILQVHKKDVFVPDALTNILLIGSIPFAFYIFGRESIAFFFLWSAILAFLFYMPLSRKSSLEC